MSALPVPRKTLACIAALAVHPLLLPLAAKSSTSDTVAWIASVTLAACLLRWHMPRSAHSVLLCVILTWLFLGTGLAQVGAVALFLCSAWTLGHLMLRWMRASAAPVASILTGTALWVAIWGALMHFPINRQALHITLCLLPFPFLGVLKDIDSLRENCCNAAASVQNWARAIPFWAWVVGLIFIGWSLRWSWFPSVAYDDHAMHLRYWTELDWQQRFSFDVQSQIWSVEPFARDLLHAGQSLMAGADTRGACNLALALILLTLLARMLHQWGLKPLYQWTLLVLFASTPMLGNLLLSLQTELFLGVLALAGVAWLGGDKNDDWRNHLPTVLASAALCAATKLPGAVLGLSLLATLALRAWGQRGKTQAHTPHRPCWSAWSLFLLALAFVALHSYVVAWTVTGNPVFPLYNGIFQSPYAPANNFPSTGYIHGFSLWNYILVFFKTSKFMGSGDFTAGWQYLLLLPLAALVLLRPNTPSSLRLLAVPTFGFGIFMFSSVQYWRYMFPVMPVASAMMATLFLQGNTKIQHGKLLSNTALVLCLLCIFLNMARFSMAASGMASNPPASAASFTQEHDNLRQKLSPILTLTEKINQLVPNGSRVLYPPESPSGALLRGTPLYTNWYAPTRQQRVASIKSDADVADFLAKEYVDFVILKLNANLDQTPQELLRKHLTLYGLPLVQSGDYVLYRVSEIPAHYINIFSLREQLSSQESIKAEPHPRRIADFSTKKAIHALYRLEFQCLSNTGFFIAQINWDNGEVYYRRVRCSAQREVFTEAIPIPPGANRGHVYVTSREAPWVRVDEIAVDAR